MFERVSHFARLLTQSKHRRRQLWYPPVLGTAMALMMLRLIWLAKWLPVDGFAALAFGLLLSSALSIVGALGLQQLLQRDLPGMLVHGREADGQRLLVQTCMVAGCCFLFALPIAWLSPIASAYPSSIWAAGLLHGLSQQLFLIVTTDSRSRGDPLQFAFDNLYRALAAMAMAWPIAVLTGSAAWVLAAEAVVSIALSAIAFRRTLKRGSLGLLPLVRAATTQLGQLPWRNAGFLLAAALLGYGLMNIDRWVASAWLSKTHFAQYAFAAIGLMVAQSLQSLLNAAAFPLVARRRATEGTAAAYRIANRLALASLALGATLGPLAVLAAQLAVSRWFPQYQAALPLVWPLCALAVLRMSDFYSTFLLVSGRERTLTYMNSAILVAAGVAILVVPRHANAWHEIEPLWQVAWLALSLGCIHFAAVSAISWRLRHHRAHPQE